MENMGGLSEDIKKIDEGKLKMRLPAALHTPEPPEPGSEVAHLLALGSNVVPCGSTGDTFLCSVAVS